MSVPYVPVSEALPPTLPPSPPASTVASPPTAPSLVAALSAPPSVASCVAGLLEELEHPASPQEVAHHLRRVQDFAVAHLSCEYTLRRLACRFTYQSYEFKELAQGLLPLPIWIPQMSFAFGSVLLLVAVLDEFVIVARGGVPTFVRLTAERHAKGDFSSDI